MKAIFRFLSSGVLMTAFVAVGITVGYAQDPAATPVPQDPRCADADGQTAVYLKFTEAYPKTAIPDRKAAIEAGKQFLEKYGSCETVKEQADYLKGAVPKMEEALAKVEAALARSAILKRFDTGFETKKWDEVYAAGSEFVSRYPDDKALLNIMIPLGTIGLYESYNKNYKYNDDTLKYAKMAIEKIKSGTPSDKYGVYNFEYKTKENALSELNYAIGYINYYAKNDKKAALPYYYDVSQTTGKNKNEPRVYATVGAFYVDEAAPLGEEIAKLIELQKGTGTDEEKLAREKVIKEKVALFNGYAERALDAFSRAHKAAAAGPDTPANKTLKDGLYKQLQTLFERRFETKVGLDTYIVATVAKPMPNPTSPVTPVADPEPAPTTTTTTTTTTTAPATTAKPATTTPTKPASATITKVSATGSDVVAKPAETSTAVKAKPAVRKTVVKKKGKG